MGKAYGMGPVRFDYDFFTYYFAFRSSDVATSIEQRGRYATAYAYGLVDSTESETYINFAEASQASPDHGFCGVHRAQAAGDPSCLELR